MAAKVNTFIHKERQRSFYKNPVVIECFMAPIGAKEIKSLLAKHGAAPIKALGQNFLTNRSALEKIASYANREDVIIEVGPGLGALTERLAKRSKKIIAVEKDKKIAAILGKIMKECTNVEIIKGDIKKIPESFFPKSYKVIANPPYYISAAIIRLFLENKNPPQEMILTVQKEVAQRICAKPPDMSILAVSVRFFSDPEILFNVSRNCFWPMPNVDSAALRIVTKKDLPKIAPKDFFAIVKAGFSRPRAQLLNNLSKALKLEKEYVRRVLLESGIAPDQRAETLDINSWIEIAENFIKTK